MAGELDWGTIRNGNEGGGKTNFMKLEPGMNQARIVGRPYQVDIHWEKGLDGQNKKVICPGAGCPVCKAGKVPMARYQVQVINRKTNDVEVLEGGPRIFGAVKEFAMDPDYGDPTKYDLKIKKEGSGRETKYTVIAAPKRSDLTPEEANLVANSKTLADVNKAKTPEEILQMGLEILAGSIGDLDKDDSDPWGTPAAGDTTDSGSKDLGISDDDWNSL
jgi:hypothetical protein